MGFDASPGYVGRDTAGRDVLTYLPGRVAGSPPPTWAADDLLAGVAVLLRRLNEASTGYGAATGFAAPAGSMWRRNLVRLDPPPHAPRAELVSHLDLTPQNVVVRDGRAVGLIDFDLAGPTTRLATVFNAAMHWVPLRAEEDAWPGWEYVDPPRRLRLFADAFGLTAHERTELVPFGIVQTRHTWRLMRASAEQLGGGWARMWQDGVGDKIRRRERWLIDNESALRAGLTANFDG